MRVVVAGAAPDAATSPPRPLQYVVLELPLLLSRWAERARAEERDFHLAVAGADLAALGRRVAQDAAVLRQVAWQLADVLVGLPPSQLPPSAWSFLQGRLENAPFAPDGSDAPEAPELQHLRRCLDVELAFAWLRSGPEDSWSLRGLPLDLAAASDGDPRRIPAQRAVGAGRDDSGALQTSS